MAALDDAINQACLRYADLTGLVTAYTSAVTVDSSGMILPAAMPADYIRPIHVMRANVVLDCTSEVFETLKDASWRTAASSTARRWFVDRGNTIQLVPKENAAANIVIRYVAKPTTLVAPSDTVDSRIPVPVQAHLKYAAAAYLLMFRGPSLDLSRAATYMNTFEGLIGFGKPAAPAKEA